MQRKLVVIADKNVQTRVDPEIDPLSLASNIGIKEAQTKDSLLCLLWKGISMGLLYEGSHDRYSYMYVLKS